MPEGPKIYHIVHLDRLSSIIKDGYLWSDAIISRKNRNQGTTIGLSEIKKRRLKSCLSSYPKLHVGECVPFYFCPRSVMLYLIERRNPSLEYKGGQSWIIHLQADLYQTIQWAERQQPPLRWAFTTSNAGSFYFEDYNNLDDLEKISWQAVHANNWQECKEGKQAEFLLERCFPWHLVERIGVYSEGIYNQVKAVLHIGNHRPSLAIERDWYY